MVGTVDLLQPQSTDLLLIGLAHRPGVRDDRDIGQLAGGHESLDDRQHGLGLGLVPLERRHHQREVVGAGEQADSDLRFQAALVEHSFDGSKPPGDARHKIR